ncbi:Putative AC9 transposase [Linum perenne]
MIIMDELPFRFVEHDAFRGFVFVACPRFKIPCRKTIREDCVKLFFEAKEKLRKYFKSKCSGRVSLTNDSWTSVNNTNYMCVTTHFICKDWKLHKTVINFRKITSHKGMKLGRKLLLV